MFYSLLTYTHYVNNCCILKSTVNTLLAAVDPSFEVLRLTPWLASLNVYQRMGNDEPHRFVTGALQAAQLHSVVGRVSAHQVSPIQPVNLWK